MRNASEPKACNEKIMKKQSLSFLSNQERVIRKVNTLAEVFGFKIGMLQLVLKKYKTFSQEDNEIWRHGVRLWGTLYTFTESEVFMTCFCASRLHFTPQNSLNLPVQQDLLEFQCLDINKAVLIHSHRSVILATGTRDLDLI